jgi:cysteinyl-tRNA synthetase
MLRVLGLDASSTASAAEPAAPTSRALRDSLGRLVESTLARRRRARDDADFALADSLRDELARAGVVVRDTATGTTTWTWSGRS